MTTSSGPIIDRQVAIGREDATTLPVQADIEHWVGATLRHLQSPESKEITVRFVSREESQTLNREYRGKNRPTNVLSFPFDMPAGLDIPLLGDLVICHDVVAQEAREQHKTLLTHYAHMIVHGTLHLLGHDHIENNEAEQMERLETEILAMFGIADPYAQPSHHDNGNKRLDA